VSATVRSQDPQVTDQIQGGGKADTRRLKIGMRLDTS